MHFDTITRAVRCMVALLPPLMLSSCFPSYNLQQFSARLLTSPGTIQIEQGKKDQSMEMSASFSGTLDNRTITGNDGSYYDLEKHSADPDVANCSYTTARRQADFYCAILGKKLVCGKFESQLGMINSKMYYNFSAGIGARLYRGNIAGRIWGSVGLAKAGCEVFVLERDDSVYDLRDTYDDNLPFADITLAFNTKSPTLGVNPFVNISVRYYSLFRYNDISVSLVPIYLCSGIYKDLGPLTASCGFQLSGYDTNELFSVHSAITGQITWHLW